MKLIRKGYFSVDDTAVFYLTQAGHREIAVDHAIQLVRYDASKATLHKTEDAVMADLLDPAAEWVIEALLQGAWIREYHEWETATKNYFEHQHRLNGLPQVDWKAKITGTTGGASHVDRVRDQLAQFGATIQTDALDIIDAQRRQINIAKHEGEYFVTEHEYRALVCSIKVFWDDLASKEQFTV